ncbi:CDP-glycerol glycerophosphotransferase family protein [Terrilactibacillus laevilacticus]|uniref:CDP-glycerol glycerophosphotransferase family protein n=1 Tax=Terrilactibacillus laevilacticus TaxID=1380157 RepID=UPI001FE8AA7F|nr:CDP-glycerol glycerophosphotransferase family protein [Terrilactibacillus laevilacticus]
MKLFSHHVKKKSFLCNLKVFSIKWLYHLLCLLPLKDNRILFLSDSRTDVSGNFEYVYKELINRDIKFDYKFVLKVEKKNKIEVLLLVYYLATSKFIFLDDYYPLIYPLKIRKNAEVIQLWHAVGAFKKFGYSRVGLPGGPHIKSKSHRNYTKAIVSSKNVIKHYSEGFGISEDKILSTGIPRTDLFFDENKKEKIRKKFFNKYPFLKNKKIITFAPTFRGNGKKSAHYPFQVVDLEKLYSSFSKDYIFLFKMHPFIKQKIIIPDEYKEFFYDFSTFREINQLLIVTDILITDYSSVCFEFALLNKPMVFFAFDMENYLKTRNFYYKYDQFVPGPIVRNTNELIKVIKHNHFNLKELKSFVNYFFDHMDGCSSARVVDELIFKNN